MSDYTPDRWTVLRIHTPQGFVYKVFAVWSGGYTAGDSWQLNSGITCATWSDPFWNFNGASGSVYRCHKGSYGTNGYGQVILNRLVSQALEQDIQINVMERETDWGSLQYEALAQWIEKGTNNV